MTIHIATGTKAQLIKMAPIIRALRQKDISCRILDLGQHARTTATLRRWFRIPEPDWTLFFSDKDVSSFADAERLLLRFLGEMTLPKNSIRSRIFGEQGGICLIHGDTLSTLMSLLLAKKAGLDVGLVEAGLKSERLLQPFPEEIIRRICAENADLLFAPGDWAVHNLKQAGVRGRVIDSKENSIAESILYSLSQPGHDDALPSMQPYALASFHRVENILNPMRLVRITNLIRATAKHYPTLVTLHGPTRRALERFRLYERLQHSRVSILDLQPYQRFLRLIRDAAVVITDGGSVQEECYYLGRPCLIMRQTTERLEGLGQNAELIGCEVDRLEYRLNRLESLKRSPVPPTSPSRIIVEEVERWLSER